MLERQLNKAIERQGELNIKSDDLNSKIFDLDNEILEVKVGNDTAAELGPLKYLSEITGKSMDEVMKYFIFLLILIGDPMAVLMVIVFNKVVNDSSEDKKKDKPEKKSRSLGSLFKNIKIPKIPTLIKKSNKPTPIVHNQVKPQVIDEVVPDGASATITGKVFTNYMDITEEPKEESTQAKGDRGFSVKIPERKKNDTINRIGSNKETRNGDDNVVYFKKR